MHIKPRQYQIEAEQNVNLAWQTNDNVLLQLPTGAGKTFTFSSVVSKNQGYSCTMAHRQELVSQISSSFAKYQIKHRIIAPKNVIKDCVNIQMEEFGHNFYDPQAPRAVASVDTLLNRIEPNRQFLNSCNLWVMDEAHHILRANKWGKCVDLFPNARGLGVTATACRADGMGLGAHADGVFHELVLGPDTRDLMDMGYLTEYRIVSCPTFLNLDDKKDISSSTGDYKQNRLVAATEESSIVGDVVSHYLKFAKGKLGITFVPSIKIADEIAEQFRNAGVPAMALSSKNTNMERHRALRDFRNKKLMQLINVDLFGEGFDLPAIECISIARKTQSLSLHLQMLGRVLRIMEGKGKALIIDHVGNCLNPHLGLPDKRRTWSLDRRERRSNKASDEKPLKVCVNPECVGNPYERHHVQCPYCGFRPESMPRNDPDFVDGSLVLFDDELLNQLRGDIQKVDRTCEEYRAELINKKTPMKYQMIQIKRHDNLQKCIKLLRESMAWWAGYHRAMNRCDEEIQKRFYLKFRVDMLTAQTLNVKSAQELTFKINSDLTELAKEYNNVQSISMG